jgi:RNA polymerase sigma-70 factor (ECF subfamily)
VSTKDHELCFRQLLAEHTGLLIKVVRSFADDSTDANDLFQEILLQVWLSLPNFRQEAKLSTWLYRVALNTALAWKRRESKYRRREVTFLPPEVVLKQTAEGLTDWNDQTIDRLYAAIRTLPPAKRALLVLHLDGFSYREIADVIGISETNVGARLNRVKKELAAIVKEVHNEP